MTFEVILQTRATKLARVSVPSAKGYGYQVMPCADVHEVFIRAYTEYLIAIGWQDTQPDVADAKRRR